MITVLDLQNHIYLMPGEMLELRALLEGRYWGWSDEPHSLLVVDSVRGYLLLQHALVMS